MNLPKLFGYWLNGLEFSLQTFRAAHMLKHELQRAANSGFTSRVCPAFFCRFMDIFWSIFAMPIGVTLCFGPAVIVWWLTKDKEAARNDQPGGKH